MINHNIIGHGTYFRAHHFSQYLINNGHEVTVVTISPKRHWTGHEYLKNGIHIIETPDLFWSYGRSGWDPWDTIWRLWYLRCKRFDIIHAFDSRPAVILPALFSKKLNGGKLVIDWADWWGRGGTIVERNTSTMIKYIFSPIETFFEEYFRKYADGTTVISNALFDRVIKLGVPENTVKIIPQGSDVENIRPLPKNICRNAFGFSKNIKMIGYLGILSRSDSILLFDTFRQLLKSCPNCYLLLIGNHRTKVIDKYHIIETGYVSHDQLQKYLGCCDLFILPLKDTIANHGRWPSKINDYLSAGRPIVASDVGDIVPLFNNHNIGKATVDKPEALSVEVCLLLSNKTKMKEMGINARKLAESQFAWPIITKKLEDHYMNILKGIS